MLAARRLRTPVSSPARRRSEPKSLALLVDIVLARYGIVPINPQAMPAASKISSTGAKYRCGEQTLLFPLT